MFWQCSEYDSDIARLIYIFQIIFSRSLVHEKYTFW